MMIQLKTDNDLCQFLNWDSDFFGNRIARVNRNTLSDETLTEVINWCKSQTIDCLYFLADADDPNTIRLVEDQEFHLVEIRITTERQLNSWDPDSRPKPKKGLLIRSSIPEDIPALQAITQNSYIDSRYYFDPCFSNEKSQAFYQTWIKNSCLSEKHTVLIAEKNSQVLGYISVKEGDTKSICILELASVKQGYKRQGLARELFSRALDLCALHGKEQVIGVTQGRNIATLSLLQSLGFKLINVQLYYHKWFSNCN